MPENKAFGHKSRVASQQNTFFKDREREGIAQSARFFSNLLGGAALTIALSKIAERQRG